MAKFLYIGESITYTNEGDTAIGYHDTVALGSCIGVAAAPIAPGASETVLLAGIWEMPAVKNTAFAIGDILYWNDTDKNLTKDTAGIPAGMCTAPKATAGDTAQLKLFGNGVIKPAAVGQSAAQVSDSINAAISDHNSNSEAHAAKFSSYATTAAATSAVNAHDTNAQAHATKFANYQEKAST